MITEIPFDHFRVRTSFGNRHIGIGPQQIKAVAPQARGFERRSPVEHMQWQMVLVAPGDHLVAGVAIDMYLPGQALERLKIIPLTVMGPGQAIATMHVPGNARAQRHSTIIEGDLRHRAKHEFARGFERGYFRYQERGQACTQQVGNSPIGSDEVKYPVGGGHQFACKRDALGFIGVEQSGLCAAAQHGRQFPGQVDGIANPGVHALAARRAVHVGGIPQ
ncbi:hypothetical protein D3C78_539440 [compost metagenome]